MALRYLARIGLGQNDTALREAAARAGLSAVYETANLAVFTNDPARALVLANGDGVILGHVFTRPPAPTLVTSLSDADANAITDTEGQYLIARFWGGYVAYLNAPGAQVCIRDPSGTLPCLTRSGDGSTLFASDIDIFWAADLLTPEVDWAALAAHLRAPDMRTPRTCLMDISELLAGSKWTSQAPKRQSLVWSPWPFTAAKPVEEPAAIVRAVVTDCVRAWASAFSHVLLGVSGGLDSSVMTASAAQSSARLSCLTMATDEAEGDERAYARTLTDHLNLPLTEAFHSLADTQVGQATSAHLPRPIQTAFGQSERALKADLGARLGADAFFNGIGGDNVFCHMRSSKPILDRFCSEGLSGGMFDTWRDVCALTGASVWEVAAQLIALWRSPPGYRWQTYPSFLTPEGSVPVPWVHPWRSAPPGALPGKATHVAMLTRIQATLDGYPRDLPPLINPLLSQPIVETCLGIPTWQWCAGGRDRAPVRGAFNDLLPSSLIQRRSKGGPNSFAYAVIDENKPQLRALLLDGLLVQNGIADQAALADALSDARPLSPTIHMRVSAIAEAEVWARHWTHWPSE